MDPARRAAIFPHHAAGPPYRIDEQLLTDQQRHVIEAVRPVQVRSCMVAQASDECTMDS